MAATAADWIARSAWYQGSLGRLVLDVGVVEIEHDHVNDRLWALWIALPRYPTVIEALRPGRLRYAAIDWTDQPITLDSAYAQARLAARGIELAQTLEWVLSNVKVDNAGWFANPIALYDLEGELRVAFVTGRKVTPPETLLYFPQCDERGFVYVVGKLLLRMIAGPTVDPIAKVLQRATAEDPAARFATLEDLVETLRNFGAAPRPRAHLRRPRRHWAQIERGLGFLALGQRSPALTAFLEAVTLARGFPLASDLYDHTLSLPRMPLELSGEIIASSEMSLRDPMPAAIPHILRHDAPLEMSRSLPRRVYATANGKIASSVLGAHPISSDAPEAPIAILLRTRRYADALAVLDATPSEDAAHHHLRGKALLGLGRLDDARTAFDHACSLDPRCLEAMLLRREVDRAILVARATAGTAQPMRSSLPPHLAELRDVLVAGRIVDAIQMLRRPAYDDDTVAQMLLAELLCADDRASDALEIYDRLASPAARLGRVRALISLDRAGEALIEAEDLIGTDDEALELRARALLALNRGDEAEAQLAEYMQVIAERSERRVRSL